MEENVKKTFGVYTFMRTPEDIENGTITFWPASCEYDAVDTFIDRMTYDDFVDQYLTEAEDGETEINETAN